MRTVVLQSNYLPWRGYFDLIQTADQFVFYDEVQYTKNDWRNRNRLRGKNGSFWITIPIEKESVRRKISEVALPDSDWQNLHYRSICQSYASAPHRKEIDLLIEDIYQKSQWRSLGEMNQYVIRRISDELGLKTKFIDSKDLLLEGDRENRLLSVLKQVDASEYVSGPSAKDYLLPFENHFSEEGVPITYHDYSTYRQYEQLSSPFDGFVSIVDLLVNVPRSEWLKYISPI
jgi:hypothetical protein